MDIDSPFTMVVLIVLIAVGSGVVNNWLKMKQQAGVGSDAGRELEKMRRELSDVQERVRNLEKIATDDDHRLRAEIDALKR